MTGTRLTSVLVLAILIVACINVAVGQDESAVSKPVAEAQSSDATIPLYIKLLLGKNGASMSGGVTYIRWGRTNCPDVEGTKLVYAGRAAGSYFGKKGGTSDYLCLPDQPQYLSYRRGVQNYSPLYGAEYELPLHRNLHNHNVPCAVCHSTARGSLLMIPARLSCPDTWTLEYSGYLMSEHRGHYRSSAECVDKDAQALPGSSRNTNGALFYHMEATCNGIRCPPYARQKELTCAVCTK